MSGSKKTTMKQLEENVSWFLVITIVKRKLPKYHVQKMKLNDIHDSLALTTVVFKETVSDNLN